MSNPDLTRALALRTISFQRADSQNTSLLINRKFFALGKVGGYFNCHLKDLSHRASALEPVDHTIVCASTVGRHKGIHNH